MSRTETFTSESVCAGHPDKICDQVSDAIVDAAYLANQNPQSVRVAVESLATTNTLVMAGEVTSATPLDYENIARRVIENLDYKNPNYGFWYGSDLIVKIHAQSPDIALGVDTGGAGDQGMMFGFACRETPELMPLPIMLAHRLARGIDEARKTGAIEYLRPDGKTEVTIRYEDGKPTSVERLVLAVPHEEKVNVQLLKTDLYQHVVSPALDHYGLKFPKKDIFLNNTGRWHQGGPAADTGETGRKIMVDTYGAMARQGGGCFSGKDPTKVDRSGAYACRFIAKNLVAEGLADRVEFRVAYVIGEPEPIDQFIETFGTERRPIRVINSRAQELLNLSVTGILETLDLRRPIYQKTACYGHFGRSEFPWERIVS